MGYLSAFKIGSSALSAQRLRLDVISNNIANSETTRTETGGPYQRKDVVFKANNQGLTPAGNFLPVNRSTSDKKLALNGVQVTEIFTDTTPGTRVYDPTHADADADGYVTYPNVNMVVEMTNMLSASRSYEAGLSIIDAARTMAQKAIDIGNA